MQNLLNNRQKGFSLVGWISAAHPPLYLRTLLLICSVFTLGRHSTSKEVERCNKRSRMCQCGATCLHFYYSHSGYCSGFAPLDLIILGYFILQSSIKRFRDFLI